MYNECVTATACDGNRRDQFPPGNLFVSVSEGLWDNGAACGRRYRIRCVSGRNRPCKNPNASVDVKVVDFCAKSPCPNTLLMSKDAFTAISRFSNAQINIEYTQSVFLYSPSHYILFHYYHLSNPASS